MNLRTFLSSLSSRISKNFENQSQRISVIEDQLRYAQLFGNPPFLPEETTPPELLVDFLKMLVVNKSDVEMVRVGSGNDGGYVLPKVNSLTTLVSAGIQDNCDFELELAESGLDCYLFDFSIDKPPVPHPSFNFQAKYLANRSSGQKAIGLPFVVRNLNLLPSTAILKLDIEGSEWTSLASLNASDLDAFSVVVAEFHWFEFLSKRWSFDLMYQVLSLLHESFYLVNSHPNNFASEITILGFKIPRVIELTFLKKQISPTLIQESKSVSNLNTPNNPESPEIIMSLDIQIQEWRRTSSRAEVRIRQLSSSQKVADLGNTEIGPPGP